MKEPLSAGKIVAAVVKAVNIPVTVKMRTGYDNENINAVYLAQICEDAGAAAITVHGRTRPQMYAPGIDYKTIAEVKKPRYCKRRCNGRQKCGVYVFGDRVRYGVCRAGGRG